MAVKAAKPPTAGTAARLPRDLEVLQLLDGVPSVPRLVGLCKDAWGRDALMTAPVGEVLEWLAPVETQTGRKINPVCYSRSEFDHRRQEEGSFVQKILAQPWVALAGDVNGFG